MSGMSPEERRETADRLRLALDMAATGESLMRGTLRRRHPEADEDTIERMIVAWYGQRPGAESGDGEGRPVPWPRSG
jgi:hypothetical protein